MERTALITGASGQDGSYLTELLLGKGYHVLALDRVRNEAGPDNLAGVRSNPRFELVKGDLLEAEQITALVRERQPSEVYNLAAQSFIPRSWEMPIYTAEVNAMGPLRLLEAIRRHSPQTRFYQASSSEIYGKAIEFPQTERTAHYPRSPYAAAKSFGMNITRNYRESFGLFACNGILFNHESERRGPTFVTRKVTIGVAAIVHGNQEDIAMGNIDVSRDWGYAPDYVRAMWMMLQAKQADDYVIATGQVHTVREFIEHAFSAAGIWIHWSGTGVDEVGKDDDGNVRVRIDPTFFRPAEVNRIVGNAGRANTVLGWKPEVDFRSLVRRMVDHDLAGQKAPSRR